MFDAYHNGVHFFSETNELPLPQERTDRGVCVKR